MRGIVRHCENISYMASAYDIRTKNAKIYAEFEQVTEEIIEGNLQSMGAESVIIYSFSSEDDDWEMSSRAALKSVLNCRGKSGFLFSERGSPTIDREVMMNIFMVFLNH